MKRIVVLGVGLVGKAIAIDLSSRYEVTAVDINPAPLSKLKKYKNIRTQVKDMSREGAVKEIVKDFDLVIGAVPGFMGYRMVREVIEAGKNMVDISFFSEDPFTLDELAKKKGVTIVTDCGVAPGMGNLILGYYNNRMRVNSFRCLVGGLPILREWPWEYRAVFSPIDVIEEYIRPARYVQSGRIVVREALSDPELIHFDRVGTLEAWNSDGLRSLLHTMTVPNMIEKTLRYPGTIEYLRVLRDTGYFSYDEIEVRGQSVRPIDVTAKLLFDKWKLASGEKEYTIMRIEIEGEDEKNRKRIVYNLYDEYDSDTKTTSMARTTGYACNAVANLLLEGKYHKSGICPPEFVGRKQEHFNYVMDYLKERNVIYFAKEKVLSSE
ncbi:MAG: saccharopine dehydrogenase family protein [Marinifilaceae bacterium]